MTVANKLVQLPEAIFDLRDPLPAPASCGAAIGNERKAGEKARKIPTRGTAASPSVSIRRLVRSSFCIHGT
jgi:hypothetical protein